MLLDIVILPPKKVRQKLGKKIIQATKGVSTALVVDNKKFIPHLSLFHIRTSRQKLEKELTTQLRELVKKVKPFMLHSTGMDIAGNWFGIRMANLSKLKKLHLDVLGKSYGLRTGKMPSTSKTLLKIEKEYRKKYGSRHILKLFRPHITLARFRNTDDIATVATKMSNLKIKFPADTIAITEVNFWYQVTRIIKKFKLR